MMTQSVESVQTAQTWEQFCPTTGQVNYLTERVENFHLKPAYRYTVEVASYTCDRDGIPDTWKILDVVVSERSIEKVRELVETTPWLKGFGITSYWEETEDPNEAPF